VNPLRRDDGVRVLRIVKKLNTYSRTRQQHSCRHRCRWARGNRSSDIIVCVAYARDISLAWPPWR
jgi:hypothetical protein